MKNLSPDLRIMPAINLIFYMGVWRFGKERKTCNSIYLDTTLRFVNLSQKPNDDISLASYRTLIGNLFENC